MAPANAQQTPGTSRTTFEVAFDPPAVQDAQAGDTVERRFHSARARSFQRELGGVEPEVDAGGDFSADFHVVFVEEDDGDGFLQRFLSGKNVADDVFAATVVRVSFARVNDLKFTGVFGDLAKAIEVTEDQIGALVTGGAACKTDGENIGIERESRLRAHGLKQIVLRD